MKYTSNYKFKKPEPSDYVNIMDLDENFDSIDAEFKKSNDKIDIAKYSSLITATQANNQITTDTRKQLKLVNIKGKTIADGVNPEKSIENASFETKDIANNLISKATISHPLRSLSTVYDEVNEGVLTKRIEKMNLDGSANWVFDNSGVGYKVVTLNIYNVIQSSVAILIKYNNKKIVQDLTDAGDKFSLNADVADKLVLSIPNTDSGWGVNYTPTSEEIKAYFNGWKMRIKGQYGTLYNGTAEKQWVAVNTTSAWISDTLPTSTYAEWTPYRLYYQLAKPQTIDLNLPNLVAEPNGSLIITSDYGIVPETQYQLSDNLKSNVDELMVNVNKETNKINTLESKLNNISNPNLLINGDFQVWQRGEKLSPTYGGKYCSDRWMLGMSKSSGITAKKVKNGINITRVINDSIYYIGYYMEQIDIDKIKGKTCTLSLLANGKIYKKTGKIPESFAETEFIVIIRNDDYNAYNSPFCIRCDLENNNITIEYIKLELGDKATPFVPRSYAEELAMCQRYYLPIPDTWFTGHKLSGSNVRVGIPLSTTMRIIPTLVNQNIQYYTATGWTIASELNVNSFSDTMISLSFNTDLSDNMSCLVKGVPDLDAEIY